MLAVAGALEHHLIGGPGQVHIGVVEGIALPLGQVHAEEHLPPVHLGLELGQVAGQQGGQGLLVEIVGPIPVIAVAVSDDPVVHRPDLLSGGLALGGDLLEDLDGQVVHVGIAHADGRAAAFGGHRPGRQQGQHGGQGQERGQDAFFHGRTPSLIT